MKLNTKFETLTFFTKIELKNTCETNGISDLQKFEGTCKYSCLSIASMCKNTNLASDGTQLIYAFVFFSFGIGSDSV